MVRFRQVVNICHQSVLLLSILCLSQSLICISLFYHCFDFHYGSFVRFVDLIATIVSFVSRQVSEFCIKNFQNTCVSMKDNRLVQTANYVVAADFTVISGFRYLFFDVFCVPGAGRDLELILTIFRRPTHGCFTKISGHRHKSPLLPAPPPPFLPPGLYIDRYITRTSSFSLYFIFL